MTSINLVFINKTSGQPHTVPVTRKSEAQSLIDLLDKKKVQDIRVSYLFDGKEHAVYVAHSKTYQLVKV